MAHDDSPDHDDPDPERDVVAEADAMADALEDQAPEPVSSPTPELPRALLIPALLLSAAIAAPLTPEGYSFAQILYVVFSRSVVEGVITLLGFGSPFVFGLLTVALVLAGKRLHPAVGERLLVANLSLLHTQLVLVAGLLAWNGQGKLPIALLGFAIVSGGFFILQHAKSSAAAGGLEHAPPRGPTQAWLVRWGATVIVAVCGWIRLQTLVDVRLGWAIELMLGAGMMMTVLVAKRR